MAPKIPPVLHASSLNLWIETKTGTYHALRNIDLELERFGILGIQGHSGAGKSILSSSIAGLLQDDPIYRFEGTLDYRDESFQIDLLKAEPKGLELYRKAKSAIIFQDPYASLNPNRICGKQLEDVLILQGHQKPKQRALEILNLVGFDTPRRVHQSYPHQLSGGECQRIVVACVLASAAPLIIADEPTSSLDSYSEGVVMETLFKVKESLSASLILVSHDVRLIKQWTQTYLLMENGTILSKGLSSNLSLQKRYRTPTADISTETPNILEINHLSLRYPRGSSSVIHKKYHTVVEDFNLHLKRGQILGLTGRSGTGKTSIAKAILRTIPVYRGQIIFEGNDISKLDIQGPHPLRQAIQLIMQDNYLNFNPAYRVGQMIDQIRKFSARQLTDEQLSGLVHSLGLSFDLFDLYPHQLSGGQRQRLHVLRALMMRPRLLICDECVASLDDPVKYQILDMLKLLRDTDKISILFISHDQDSVDYLCDRQVRLD